MPALGIDIAGVEDVDLFLSYAEPKRAAAEAVMRSLTHAAGRLWWAPESGHDLKSHLHSFTDDLERIQTAVLDQCEREERVRSATVEAVVFGDELRITINIILESDGSRVQLTLTINLLGEVLNASIVV